MDPAPRLRDPSQRVSPRARLMWLVGGLVRAAVLMAALLVTSLVRLASVTATTASAAGALEIAGLDRDRARSLVDELTLKADAIPGDAT